MRDYEIVSTDSHLEVPPYMWGPYVDKAFQQYVPRVVELPTGGEGWLMPGNDQPVPLGLNFSAGRGFENLKPSGLSYKDGLVGAGDGKQRLGEMDKDGVDAELLFPAVSGQRTLDNGNVPPDGYVALVRGYNDWLCQEYTAHDPDRLLGLAILPTTGIQDAMDELRRVSSMPGIRGVCLHSWPNGKGVPEPEDDEKFWRLAVELDVPLAAHMSFGGGRVAYVADLTAQGKMVGGNFAPIVAMLTKGGNGFVATQLITSGVFDRIPELQFFFAETQVGWVPYYGEDADENYKRHKYWSGLDMPHLPSWYLRRHFSWGFQIDHYGVKNRHEIGIDKLQWSTDFPHVQCDWPNSRQVIEEQFQGVPEDEKRQIVCDNAVRYFHLDRE